MQKMRILLVEDEPMIYRKIASFLQAKGHELATHAEKPFIDNYEDAVAAVEQKIPDLAILDIQLNGDKTGLQLGEYISTHYWLPIIYFTDKHEPVNALASGYHDAKGFVAKIGKPPDLTQLGLDIERVSPIAFALAKRKTVSDFFMVSQVDAATGRKDDFFTRKKIEWNQIRYITTEGAAKNTVVLHLTDGTQWSLRKTLSKTQTAVPPYLVQLNQYQIVNIRHVDRSTSSGLKQYIGGHEFAVTDTYRHTALPLIKLFFPSL